MKKVLTIKQENLFPNKNFKDLYCPDPFETVQIDQAGNVGLCGCENWHPQKIGNIFQQPLVEIFNSDLLEYGGTGDVYNPSLTCELISKQDKHYRLTVQLPPLGAVILR